MTEDNKRDCATSRQILEMSVQLLRVATSRLQWSMMWRRISGGKKTLSKGDASFGDVGIISGVIVSRTMTSCSRRAQIALNERRIFIQPESIKGSRITIPEGCQYIIDPLTSR